MKSIILLPLCCTSDCIIFCCGSLVIFVAESLEISNRSTFFYLYSAISFRLAVGSTTAILPIVSYQYSHITLSMLLQFSYFGSITEESSIKTYRELWTLARQLKLNRLQELLKEKLGSNSGVLTSRKRTKHPILRKEKDVPERKRRCIEPPFSQSSSPQPSSHTADAIGARFRIPKCPKRKCLKLRHRHDLS